MKSLRSIILLCLPLALAAVTMLTAASCGQSTSTKHPAAGKPNIVFITIDALRSDHLSCYGYNRPTSPFIDSLAKRGIRFENCISSSCWTPPAMASFCTSVYSRQHGVKHGLAQSRSIHGQEMLDGSFLTLAEALHAKGYRTYALSSNAHFSKDTGMAQGFDKFTTFWFCTAPTLHEAALGLKPQLAQSGPFFLWIHYFDTHTPLRPREPWIGQYAKHPEYVDRWSKQQIEWIRENQGQVETNADIQQTLVDIYDSEINYTDEFVKKLFDEVLPKGNTLVVISSDHGEGFMEHNIIGHAKSLYHEETHVPLIVLPPYGLKSNVTVSADVSIVDVYPTILDYAGVEIPATCRGQSLRKVADSSPGMEIRPVFSEFDRGDTIRSVVLDQWKLIVNEQGKTTQLFDLSADPVEKTDRTRTNPAMLKRLSDELSRWESATPQFDAPKGPVNLDPEQERTMRSLGYLK